MPSGIQAERVLRELTELWANLAREDQGGAGVLRACALTLLVAAEDEADAQAASETLAELMHQHPSRAIVLKPSDAGELAARVFAQCWMPFGSRQQICCEQIEITAARARLGEVPGVLLGLLAPDLPVALWCRGESWLKEPRFAELLALVDKLIVDSGRFRNCPEAFGLIGGMMAGGRRVGDLAWARLTGWREIVAQRFDTPAELNSAARIRRVVIRHAGARPGPEAFYLAAWLKRGLPGAALSFEPSGREGAHVCAVELDGSAFLLQAASNAVELKGAATEHTVVLPQPNDYRAMREELSITGDDRVFREVFAIARELAEKT